MNFSFRLIVTSVFDLSRLSRLSPSEARWAMGGVLTVSFAVLARLLRGVTNSGAIAGAAVCFVLYVGGGPGAFAALITVFGLTWITTRLGYQRKQGLGTAERRDGRKASQVLANLGVAAACAAVSLFSPDRMLFMLAMAAALSEAAADTVSSELGQAFSAKARLITSWRPVPPGTNGAVSLAGSLAGVVAAGIVSAVCVLWGLVPRQWLPLSAVAAVLGMVADSFLGAWLERRGLVNNDTVNFLGTLIAALAAFCLA